MIQMCNSYFSLNYHPESFSYAEVHEILWTKYIICINGEVMREYPYPWLDKYSYNYIVRYMEVLILK